MSSVEGLRATKVLEMEGLLHNKKLRDEKNRHGEEFEKLVNKNLHYLDKKLVEFNKDERSLIDETKNIIDLLRDKKVEIVDKRQKELEQAMFDLRVAHDDKIAELRQSQFGELQNLSAENIQRIQEAQKKFIKHAKALKT